jgi:predicted DNA binding CopG/RHH family protein
MAGPSPILKARFDADTHERFLVAARKRGLKDSELLRLAVNRELDQTETCAAEVAPDPDQAQQGRVTVRMPSFLMDAAKERAKAKGMKLSRWIAALVQSNLTKHPVLTDAELKTVDATARELSAIGRNINQIARALSESHFQAERVRIDRLAELAEAVNESREAIRSLVRASRQAWSDE